MSMGSEISWIFATAISQAYSKPSAILRINDGDTEFDEDYYFDIENAPNGGKLFWMDYIGDGKALGRIVVDDTVGPWNIFLEQGEYFKLVVIDLESQTVTDVAGVPVHASRYISQMYVEDGIAYLTCRSGDAITWADYSNIEFGETYVYSVNPETAIATQGAKVLGSSLKGIFKISN